MQLNHYSNSKVPMSDPEFIKLSGFIYTHFGIKLPIAKKIMIEGRLQKRLLAVGLPSFKSYFEFVTSKEGQLELLNMIDSVSTNKTDFFREPYHFEYMTEQLLPEYFTEQGRKPLTIWSAAASSGEEPYTLAICIEEYNKKTINKIEYSLLGTDISVEILKKAVVAVYDEAKIATIPAGLKRTYFLRNKDKAKKLVRVIPGLRSKVKFQRVNLMDDTYHVDTNFDFIFCRNVLIYFDKKTQENVINKLCSNLRKGGYFFLGHSESVVGMNVPLIQVKPTIYKKM
ncbi:CheR family methyltransferase [Fulvivirgaceae bacterium BMA12]|uniref:protein-glutamate O-methyltransferase n=1 Tax=Agaribacillus aureus TaxID=3051825 RepID=A0ABT8KZJ0_9BACT|nr:CheR family methyltransferase [Fulvivirgaceae bacterium BMA12]